MVDELQLLLQQQARKQQLEINERRREKHLPLAVRDLPGSPPSPRRSESILLSSSILNRSFTRR